MKLRLPFDQTSAAIGVTVLLVMGLGTITCGQTLPAGSQIVYDDALENGWQNYGWATLNYANANPIHGISGTSIRVDAGAYQAMYLHHDAFDSTPYASLTFWINGGTAGGQPLQIQAHVNGNALAAVAVATPQADAWQQVTVPLTSLGAANQSAFDGFWIQNTTGATLPTFYVDDIAFVANPAPTSIALQVNAGSVIRHVDARIFGLNTAIWDSQLGTAANRALLVAIGVQSLRYPGGSSSDDYDWQLDRSVTNNSFQWASSFGTFAPLAAGLGAQPYLTVNYGSGTPEQAAAWVAYANGDPISTLALGTDAKERNWQTVGYWASLRAAAPLATDDGYNFLRLSHPGSFHFVYWEIGNECYGSWEHDEHGSTFSGSPQDPYTYAQNFALFRRKMLGVDSTIHLGAVVISGQDSYGNGQHAVTNPVDGTTHTGWTPVVLANLKALGALPQFLILHDYPQEPGQESDAGLLAVASTMASTDAAGLRLMLTDYIGGTAATSIELALTEVNSVSYNPGKQSVSLVDGLFNAEMLAGLAATEFNACMWWDLRNGDTEGTNDSSALYGWRAFGDYGLVASGDRSDTALNTPFPSYRAAELLTRWAAGGDSVVAAGSNYAPLTVHAALRANGDLCLLVINKDAANNLTAQIALTSFVPGSSTATVYQYGKSNDSNNADVTASTLSAVGSTFSATFPSYSMTVIDLARPATPYTAWQNSHFTAAQLANPAVSGDLADPDGDGIVNLLEYALNLDPLSASRTGLPGAATTTQNGATNLTLTYTKVKAATDLTYTVEVSGDLMTWNSGSAYTADVGVLDQGTTEQVTTRDLTAISATMPRWFIRLRVTRQ